MRLIENHFGMRSLASLLFLIWIFLIGSVASAQDAAGAEEYETIGSEDCVTCHEETDHNTTYEEDLAHSIHEGFECLSCHSDRDTVPHKATDGFRVGCQGCRSCHEEASAQYKAHGRKAAESCEEIPQCTSCHGDHEILPSTAKASKTHVVNIPATCGKCHEDVNLTKKYDILIDHPVEIYQSSVHGRSTKGGVYVAATCNDCHSTGGSAHKILSPGDRDSSINHFNIPRTCGTCHKSIEADYSEGIHGKLAARGETDSPVCTHCHGEHGIISPDDPRSPVSRARVAAETCSPCHESAVLNEKYGLATGRLTSFIDSYHGLKSKAGDTHVANCGSCHGVHRVLPSSDPNSTVHPANLQTTCGECHPAISAEMANQPIHGVSGEGLHTPAADLVTKIYIGAIIVIIGLMLLHWSIDFVAHVRRIMASRPQVRRMTLNEVWQHMFLMVTFIVLVISGFALRFSDSFLTRLFFGWEGGFEWRGSVHRTAAIFFMFTAVWHTVYLVVKRRGREFIRDIFPTRLDFSQFIRTIKFNLGRRPKPPAFHRFSYVEKAEYWALVWGTAIMVATGLLLWFDNWFIQFLPKGYLDVALVIHYYEAWLATLAIFVWHLYSTVFSPHVYPMNPSWLTGKMPEEMYRHEHPRHIEAAKEETEAMIRAELAKLSREDIEDENGTPWSQRPHDEDVA